MSAFRKPGRDGKRAAERSRAAVTRRRIVSEDSSGAGFWISAQETAGTETCRSMRSIRGPESLRAYLVRSAYPQVQTRRESPRKPQGHGFMAATRRKSHGKVKAPPT